MRRGAAADGSRFLPCGSGVPIPMYHDIISFPRLVEGLLRMAVGRFRVVQASYSSSATLSLLVGSSRGC